MTVELADRVVKAAVDGVLAPIAVLSIDPPVTVMLFENKSFAVTAPARVTTSVGEPMWIVSGTVLSVPILMVLPEVRVPMLIEPLVLPVPALMVTDPPFPPEAVVPPATKLRFPPVAAVVLSAGLIERVEPPVSVVISAELLPARASTPFSVTVRVEEPLDCKSKSVPPLPVCVSLMIKAVAVPALVKVSDVGVANPSAKVKSMLRPALVKMALPFS